MSDIKVEDAKRPLFILGVGMMLLLLALHVLQCELVRYDYLLAREYNWNVKNKASRGYEENYFFVMKEDGVYYNELETR